MAQVLESISRILVLGLAVGGCSQSAQTVDYVIDVHPFTASNQSDLFESLDELWLVVENPDGQSDAFALPTPTSGTSPRITDLGAIPEGSVLQFEGFAGTREAGTLFAYGRTRALEMGRHGQVDVEVLVALVDAYAQFDDMSARIEGAALAPTGQGGFVLFGGFDQTGTPFVSDAVRELDVTTAAGVVFQDVATMPVSSATFGAAPISGRAGATATLLTEGDHADVGWILVAGGGGRLGEPTTPDAFLYNPSDHAITILDSRLANDRSFHDAVQMANGKVAFFGGFAYGDSDVPGHLALRQVASAEVYDPASRSFATVSLPKPGLGIGSFGASSRLGEAAMHCGGIDADLDFSSLPTNFCYVLGPDERVRATSMIPGLADEEILVGAALAPVGAGKALLSGGFVLRPDDRVFDDLSRDANAYAWLYDDPSDTWVELPARLVHPRGFHVATPLNDGRVLLSGGAEELANLDFFGAEAGSPGAMACAEVFDPVMLSFSEVDLCGEPGTGSLSTPAMLPAAATDPELGTLFVGGASDFSGTASGGVMLFVEEPQLER
jgi:hypothetical protein